MANISSGDNKVRNTGNRATVVGGRGRSKRVFLGFFDIQYLEPLSVEGARELFQRISVEQDRPELAQYLNTPEGRYQIRALNYLAGGNHRMYVLLAEFLSKNSLQDLVLAFEDLTHDMTAYFQELMKSLPDQQRQLTQCLCDVEGALTVKKIAAKTFIDDRSCSKQLGNLKAKGYVRSEKRGKKSYYDMSEPLMRLCLDVKNQRGKPLKMFARFLRAWFPLSAIKSAIDIAPASRVGEYCREAVQSSGAFRAAIARKLEIEIDQSLEMQSYQKAQFLADELHLADAKLAVDIETELAVRQGCCNEVSKKHDEVNPDVRGFSKTKSQCIVCSRRIKVEFEELSRKRRGL